MTHVHINSSLSFFLALPRKTVTALRAERPGQVLVELDGVGWRTLPAEVVLRAGLAVGLELDRPRLRALRQELRRSEALAISTRVLRRQDISTRRLEERLARRGIAPAARGEALATLQRAGLLEDERFARARATALAEREWGDAAIRHDLEQQGLDAELAARVLAGLEPEVTRAERILARHGRNARTFRRLAARGFGADSFEVLGGAPVAEGP